MSCGVKLGKAWNTCQRSSVFPDRKCHLHTVYLDGSTSARNAQLREVIRAGLSALAIRVTDDSVHSLRKRNPTAQSEPEHRCPSCSALTAAPVTISTPDGPVEVYGCARCARVVCLEPEDSHNFKLGDMRYWSTVTGEELTKEQADAMQGNGSRGYVSSVDKDTGTIKVTG